MKKVIKLSESDLVRIIKKVINEQVNPPATTGTTAQPAKQQPTSKNPLCNSSTGTGGTGTKTPYMACVWKDQFATYIKLTDTNTGSVIVQVSDENFVKATPNFFKMVSEKLPGKKIGIDLPMPINPDN